ncbi:hypothetical protein [Xenorhabdus sp. TS4]|uniref:hypothetical protein n=1 Tax=Xenorhabdus sp. TS4 TaxID=1873483 RepID=UPI001656E74C|nr:hypothetical protein [Xenorhabdus sp. TS4]MBC8949236.1 hypothetical protein [Xenorhabdus sp. TS4]
MFNNSNNSNNSNNNNINNINLDGLDRLRKRCYSLERVTNHQHLRHFPYTLNCNKMKRVELDELITTMNRFGMNPVSKYNWKRAIELLVKINAQENDCDLELLSKKLESEHKNKGFFTKVGCLRSINNTFNGAISKIFGVGGVILWEFSQVDQNYINKINFEDQSKINKEELERLINEQNYYIFCARLSSIIEGSVALLFGVIVHKIVECFICKLDNISENDVGFISVWVTNILKERYMKEKELKISGNISERSIPKLAFYTENSNNYQVYVPDNISYIETICNIYYEMYQSRNTQELSEVVNRPIRY